MKLKKIIRIPVVVFIFLIHGICPWQKLGEKIPQIRERLSESEKKFYLDTFFDKNVAEYVKKEIE